jgi:hypothetical protein
MNGSPYNEGRLVLEITEEYQGAPERVKERWREIAVQAIQEAIIHHQELFAGLILGEAKQGRNYFNQWGAGSHTTLLNASVSVHNPLPDLYQRDDGRSPSPGLRR